MYDWILAVVASNFIVTKHLAAPARYVGPWAQPTSMQGCAGEIGLISW
ncbi:hypothetical protein [Legionella rowbothamii]|nr:hypothetical protein [Legionella rowbothamii]